MLVSIGVIAVLSLQPQAWKTAGKTDYLGRAAGVLQSELERKEALIMNPNQAIPADSTNTIYISGDAARQSGDASYTVKTTVASAGTAIWRVTVKVTWPSNTTGISGSVLATRQDGFEY